MPSKPSESGRIGALSNVAAGDPEGVARDAVFVQGLRALGWSVGRNLQIDYRWSGGDANRLQAHAAELIALGPEVVLASSGVTILPLQQAIIYSDLEYCQHEVDQRDRRMQSLA